MLGYYLGDRGFRKGRGANGKKGKKKKSRPRFNDILSYKPATCLRVHSLNLYGSTRQTGKLGEEGTSWKKRCSLGGNFSAAPRNFLNTGMGRGYERPRRGRKGGRGRKGRPKG